MGYRLLCMLLGVGLTSAQVDDFKCPDDFQGYYPHLISCDKFWFCQEGEAELKTCGNGLGFIDTDPTFTLEQCAELHLVDCGARTELEAPISTELCPRLYGTFPDPESCSVFWKCLDGKANKYECPPGLAYDQEDRGCRWADQVLECKSVVVAVEGVAEEFKCPSRGAVGAFTKHAHPSDCRQYFVCIGGTPREYGCPLGTVFSIGGDEFSGKCTDPQEVPECKDYYGDLEFDGAALSKAGADTGPQPERKRTGSSTNTNINRNTINRAPVSPQAIAQPAAEIQRRPAPTSLQSIVDDVRTDAEDPARAQFKPRPRPARPNRPAVDQQEEELSSEPALANPATEPAARPNRFQVQTDRPATTVPRRQETTLAATVRPLADTQSTELLPSEDTFQPTFRAPTTVELGTLPPQQVLPTTPGPLAGAAAAGLPQPVPAAPGPNGEDYYYYYYYDDDEQKQQKKPQQ